MTSPSWPSATFWAEPPWPEATARPSWPFATFWTEHPPERARSLLRPGSQICCSQRCRPSIPLGERQACRATLWAEHGLPGWRPMGASLPFATFGAGHPLRNWRTKGAKFAVRNSLDRSPPLQLEAAGCQVCCSQLFGPSTPSPAGRQRAPSLPFATGFAVQRFGPGIPSLAGGHGSQVCSSQLFGPGVSSLQDTTVAGRHDVAKLAVRNFSGRTSPPWLHARGRRVCHSSLARS